MGTIGCILLAVLAATQAAPERVRTIHVFVALCDNAHQGIVPVPATLGNGADPAGNLYWGALYGVKTYLGNSRNWTLVSTEKGPGEPIMERVVFRHVIYDAYLVADAYRGEKIRNAVEDFLASAAGNNAGTLKLDKVSLNIRGGADLVAYVGHNGLMDFGVDQPTPDKEAKPKDAIVLACKSKPYFLPRLTQFKSRPVLLTTGLMAPEAYTLDAALTGWLEKEPAEKIVERAARAYSKYQKCPQKTAKRLFYSDPNRPAPQP